MGVIPAEVAARSQSIVKNVVMGMEDVNTYAWIMVVPIPAGVTPATNVGQATSDDATVSFTCFLFNLVTFQMIQLQHFYNYKYFFTIMMSGDWERQKGKQNYTALKGFWFNFLMDPGGRAGIEKKIYYMKERDVTGKGFNFESHEA